MADIQPMSPSLVCQQCYGENPSAVWLTWTRCLKPAKHSKAEQITVVLDRSFTMLVYVREVPQCIREVDHVKMCHLSTISSSSQPGSSHDDQCTMAHSEEECKYWKWQLVIIALKKVSEYSLHKHPFLPPSELTLTLYHPVCCFYRMKALQVL